MMPLLALLATLAAAAAPPPPAGELRTFRDWTVGCDNGLRCEAVALLPESLEWEGWTTLSFSREARADAAPVATIHAVDDAPRILRADGRRLAVRFVAGEDGFVARPERPTELIAALRDGRELEVLDGQQQRVARVSLAGAAAAMLYMDEAQRRLGTETALVRTGSRPARAVPAPPAVPRVRLAAPPGDDPIPLGEARIAELRRQSGCTLEEEGGPEFVEAVQVETGKTLILLSCGSGAYNFISVPFLAQRGEDGIAIELAPFDVLRRPGEEGAFTLINAAWDAESRLLREYHKGRGIGDCGSRAAYGWDGALFRLVHREEMDECRGSGHYVRTWQAEVERP